MILRDDDWSGIDDDADDDDDDDGHKCERTNFVRPQPRLFTYKVLLIGYLSAKRIDRDSDKDKHGRRYDSVAIQNGLIENGIFCEMINYRIGDERHEYENFREYVVANRFDAILVRINPGQIKPYEEQEKFDDLMERLERRTGILVFGNKASLRNMGSKIALVLIRNLKCGLKCSRAYYTKKEMEKGLKKSLGMSPRVLKQNRGSTGCGIWLVWLRDSERHQKIMRINNNNNNNNNTSNNNNNNNNNDNNRRKRKPKTTKTMTTTKTKTKEYDDDDDTENENSSEESSSYYYHIDDNTIVLCQEMNDNHIEEHTFKELVAFCANGRKDPDAGDLWKSTSDGNYLKGYRSQNFVVDQKLLPRISEGEIRLVFVKDELFEIIHKKPVGENGRSAVAWNNLTTFYAPNDPLFKDLTENFVKNDLQRIAKELNLAYNALPLLWTADFIPMDATDNDDNDDDENNINDNNNTRYILGEFNCSCVGLTKFRAACGVDKDMENVSNEDYFAGQKLCDLIGKKCKIRLDEHKRGMRRMRSIKSFATKGLLTIALVLARRSFSSSRSHQ